MLLSLEVAARASKLSRLQVEEVLEEIQAFHKEVVFAPTWVETTGDRDLKTSLRELGKTDFFTKEIDALQLTGRCRISIHSAKDLPDPLPEGLCLVALTKGCDPRDSLVLPEGKELRDLPPAPRVGTSSARRDLLVQAILPGAVCCDIRGSIERRLEQLDQGFYDAVVIAEAALIRLSFTHRRRVYLDGPTAPYQGQLAVLARVGDEEMKTLFGCIDSRIREGVSHACSLSRF